MISDMQLNENIYCFNSSLKLVTTVGYTGSHACGLLYQMEVDFIYQV